MEKEKKISALLTVTAIVLILLIGGGYIIKNNAETERKQQVVGQAGSDTLEMPDEKVQADLAAESVKEAEMQTETPFIYAEEFPDIFGKTAEELYIEAFSGTEEGLNDGTLDDAIYVDHNNYQGDSLFIYITEDHVLHGNYGFGYYEEIYLENIKFNKGECRKVYSGVLK